MKKDTGILFVFLALLALGSGMFFGSLAALQFIIPGFSDWIPFFKTRPLHVSLVVAWIFLASVGGIYHYLPAFCNLSLRYPSLPKTHFRIFFITGLLVLACYFMGYFGGREYWEFPPLLALPILASWMLFGFNYAGTVLEKKNTWPVYLWMWGTGIIFFFFTFSEAYLWLFPYFRNSIVRDLSIQWKAYGALVGSWNMLVYGTAVFLMEKIKGDTKVAYSTQAYLMYFLGLFNLMFGWAHHIYILPVAPWVRILSYAVSMTELIILAKIIRNWRSSFSRGSRVRDSLSYRFLYASDVWIFLNLILALAISVPAVNIYTHGTHVTVAHAMGSTIGINTMILLASCFFIIESMPEKSNNRSAGKIMKAGVVLFNLSLFVFWTSLIFAGVSKGVMVVEGKLSFREMMDKINPFLITFAVSGISMFVSVLMIIIPVIPSLGRYIAKRTSL